MSQQQHRHDSQDPRQIAMQMGMGFVCHDERKREKAVEAFAAVDRFQFSHVSDEVARKASAAYVDALWVKDSLEEEHTVDGEIDFEALNAADWSAVRQGFERRARLVGINLEYAELTTTAWRRHKVGMGDYRTPFQKAQMYELRTALQDSDYPHKPRYGQSGYGPEPARYVLGVELHDTRRFGEALEVMTPYFERIANDRRERNSEEWQV